MPWGRIATGETRLNRSTVASSRAKSWATAADGRAEAPFRDRVGRHRLVRTQVPQEPHRFEQCRHLHLGGRVREGLTGRRPRGRGQVVRRVRESMPEFLRDVRNEGMEEADRPLHDEQEGAASLALGDRTEPAGERALSRSPRTGRRGRARGTRRARSRRERPRTRPGRGRRRSRSPDSGRGSIGPRAERGGVGLGAAEGGSVPVAICSCANRARFQTFVRKFRAPSRLAWPNGPSSSVGFGKTRANRMRIDAPLRGSRRLGRASSRGASTSGRPCASRSIPVKTDVRERGSFA